MALTNSNSVTIIKDPVHGYIEIPKVIAQNIIDTPLFQRLQEVSQTGMKVLYPNATHNRFCHSLGVYHLGKTSFSYFRKNVKSQHPDVYKCVIENNGHVTSCSSEYLWNKWEFLFSLACLLHDCGHSPFSHSLEAVYDCTVPDIFEQMKYQPNDFYTCKYLSQVLGEQFKCGLVLKNKPYGAPHERMSCCMMIQEYAVQIINILTESGLCLQFNENADEYIQNYNTCKESLKKNASNLRDAKITADILRASIFRDDLEFMVRCIIGYPYAFDLEKNEAVRATIQLKNCIIELLNSKLDADNLDYTVRDSESSGYSSATIDIQRLLRSRTISVGNEMSLCSVKEADLDDEVCLQKMTHEKDEGEVDIYITGPLRFRCDDANSDCEISIDGTPQKNIRFFVTEENQHLHLHATHCCFSLMPRAGRSEANLHIKGKLSGTVTGKAYGERVLKKDTELGKLKWLKAANKICIVPAFHKSSLSVLQGAYDANNFESLWIYSHHKTTYYNSFLVFCLLDSYCAILLEREKIRLEELLKGLSPKDNWKEVAIQSNVTKADLSDTIKKIIDTRVTMGGHDYYLSTSGNFKWTTEILETIKEDIGSPSLSEKNAPDAMYVLRAAAVAALSAFSSECATSSKDNVYNKLYSIWNEVKDNRQTEIHMRWVRQILMFENLNGGVLRAMFCVIGMTQPTLYGEKEYYRSSDYDLLSDYKEMNRELLAKQKQKIELTPYEKRFHDLASEIEGRDYCRPVWKSHAEYAYYVQRWPLKIQKELNDLLLRKANNNDPLALNSSTPGASPYIFLSDYHNSGQEQLWNQLKDKFPSLQMLVFVPQQIKHKAYDLRKTYITWQKRTVCLADLSFRYSPSNNQSFFYIYYRNSSNISLDPTAILSFLMQFVEERMQMPVVE